MIAFLTQCLAIVFHQVWWRNPDLADLGQKGLDESYHWTDNWEVQSTVHRRMMRFIPGLNKNVSV